MKNWVFAVLAYVAAGTVLAQSPAGLGEVLTQVAKYEYGHSREPLSKLSDLVRASLASPSQVQAVEAALDRLLDSDATRDGKEAVCRELSVMGTERSVPVLARLLGAPPMAEMARYALDRIGGFAADSALLDMLAKAGGNTRIGIVNTLGRHRARTAVEKLKEMLGSTDAILRAAAADALASIADAPAQAALNAALDKEPAQRRFFLTSALLRCAERLSETNDGPGALAIYRRLYQPGESEMVRVAALLGLGAISGERALPVLTTALTDSSPTLRAAAIRSLLAIQGTVARNVMVSSMGELPAENQVQMLAALADRGDSTVRPVFDEALQSQNLAVRIEALMGLQRLGDASSVMPVAQRAADTTGEEQRAARQCLYGLRGAGVDRTVVESIPGAEPTVRVELIRAAAERNITEAADTLLAAAKEENAAVRREAIRALRDIAGPERAPALIGLLLNVRGSTDLTEAQRALFSALKRSSQSHAPELVAAYRSASDPGKKSALLLVMGQAGIEDTLPLFREVLKQADDEARRAAILALSQWPTAEPAADLLEAAGQPGSSVLQILALRGYIKLVSQPADRAPSETAKMLEKAMRIARQPEERRAILAALQKAPSEDSLRLAREELSDPGVEQEAKIAVTALEQAIRKK
jgi:HEAT repeat protein